MGLSDQCHTDHLMGDFVNHMMGSFIYVMVAINDVKNTIL